MIRDTDLEDNRTWEIAPQKEPQNLGVRQLLRSG